MPVIRAIFSPRGFGRLAGLAAPLAWLLAAGAFASGLYSALLVAPPDYLQGDAARILYVHVPAAWMALGVYSLIAVLSGISLIFRLPMADILARAAAPAGIAFTAVCLLTGAIWGKASWGTWWVWDARLTSVLILFFIYLGYLSFWSAPVRSGRMARAAAIFAVIGAINLPVIKYSVDWWNSLHQPASILVSRGSSIHPSMLAPLALMTAGYGAVLVLTMIYRVRGELAALGRQARQMRRRTPAGRDGARHMQHTREQERQE